MQLSEATNDHTTTFQPDARNKLSRNPHWNMKATLLSIGLLSWIVSLVSATALTYKLSANEKACFYATSEKKGAKVAFYFAVSPPRSCLPSVVPKFD